MEKTLKYLIHSYLGCDSVKGQGMAFAVDHGLGGGVGKKVCGTLLGFTSANLVLMLFLDRAMIGQFDEINGDLASSPAQALGDQTSQQGVERFFELIQVAELGGEFAQHGLASGGAAEVLTGFGDGNTGGSGEDQDMEEVGDLAVLATDHQRQVGQGVDSKIEDALTLQGLHTEAYTWGLETKG